MEFDQYPNLSEGADRVGGQLRGDKEYPFSGVTKSGRVWRKVPESDAGSVGKTDTVMSNARRTDSELVHARTKTSDWFTSVQIPRDVRPFGVWKRWEHQYPQYLAWLG